MTISSEVRKAGPFSGNDVTTAFSFSFKVFSTANVLAVSADSLGLETDLTEGVDYTVSLNANQNANPGGTVTLTSPLAAGYTLVLTSQVQNLQPTDLTNQGGFYPDVINAALDRATIQIQQLSEKVDRSAKLPITRTEDVDSLLSDIVVLADNLSIVNAVAGSIGSVNTVAGVSADVSAVAANEANINAAVADLPSLAAKVSKTGDTMTGHLSVPAGATGDQVPRSSEVVHMTGDETIAGVKTFSSSPIVPAGASGAQAVRASEAQWSPPVSVGSVTTTSVDFTPIPAGVNEIRIFLNYLEAASGNLIKLRLGTSNGVLTTGYIALSSAVTSSASTISSVTDSFVIQTSASAGDGVLGVITLHRGSGNVWEAEGVLMGTLNPRTIFVAGRISLSDESLTTLRIMSDLGGNFVGGAIYVSWRY